MQTFFRPVTAKLFALPTTIAQSYVTLTPMCTLILDSEHSLKDNYQQNSYLRNGVFLISVKAECWVVFFLRD